MYEMSACRKYWHAKIVQGNMGRGWPLLCAGGRLLGVLESAEKNVGLTSMVVLACYQGTWGGG